MSDTVLEAERAHHATARATLAQMRADTAAWEDIKAADALSTAALQQQLYRRMESLRDDPTTPLFFGRIDYDKDLGAELDEIVHVGRRHIGEIGEEPQVVDWRADLSTAFYRANAADPMGVRLRRRFGFHQGELTAYEDEDLTSGQAFDSKILEEEIERPRTGPMRDIVATIQPDQDILVRTDLEQSLAIQGAPGTGKTAVGLHRAAYLLYTYRDRLSRSGVLVIGPNERFLGYIGDVLPALGEIEATQHTVDTLLAHDTGVEIKGVDDPAAATLKGDARLAQVIRNAIWGHRADPTETLVVPYGHLQLRVPAHELQEAIEGMVDGRYETGRQRLPQRFAHRILLRLEARGETTDDRMANKFARSKPVKDAVEAAWPKVDALKLVHRLLTDADFLARSADGILDRAEQTLLQSGKAAKSPRSQKWTAADLALIDEANEQLERTSSVGHVIIDEAQDLSAMQLRALGRRATTGSVTLLGDLAQATTPWASRSWDDALGHLGKPDAAIHELIEGFRVPGAVIDYAAHLLPAIAPGLKPPRSIRHSRGELDLRPVDDALLAAALAVDELWAKPGTIGVIAPDDQIDALRDLLSEHVDDERLELTPASVAKGLEFDHVVLVEPEGIVEAEPDRVTGLRRLYVCLTRAVTSLIVVHARELPAELGDEPGNK